MQFIDLQKQYKKIEPEIHSSIQKVLEHGQYIMGPEVKELEEQLAEFVGVKHAIVNSSGTDSLLLALMALDIQPGDEVITTPFSFFATAEVIALLKAKPVFVDIDRETYNLDANLLEKAITKKSKAIITVNLYGHCADYDEINTIADKHGLPVIEDAAQSFGALYKGKKSCGLSTIGCTSFFPSKPLGGYGDSGACFTNDDQLATKLSQLRVHGQNARYNHNCVGINGRMDTIQAAILLQKLSIFPEELDLRARAAKKYDELLSSMFTVPSIRSYNSCVYAQYTIEVQNRERIQQTMKDSGIPTAVHYPVPMHLQEALIYLGYQKGDFPHAEHAALHVLSLPMHPYITEEEQRKVVEVLSSAVYHNKNEVV